MISKVASRTHLLSTRWYGLESFKDEREGCTCRLPMQSCPCAHAHQSRGPIGLKATCLVPCFLYRVLQLACLDGVSHYYQRSWSSGGTYGRTSKQSPSSVGPERLSVGAPGCAVRVWVGVWVGVGVGGPQREHDDTTHVIE